MGAKRKAMLNRPQSVGGRNLWYGLDHQPITLGEADELLGSARRIVARTDFGDTYTVSTVFLVLDHNYGDGPPILYETMVFGPDGTDPVCRRYRTREDASRGHDEEVSALRLILSVGDGP